MNPAFTKTGKGVIKTIGNNTNKIIISRIKYFLLPICYCVIEINNKQQVFMLFENLITDFLKVN